MAVQFDPIAKDESLNTTELTPRNVADVLAQELSGIAAAIGGGSDKVPKTDIATVEPTNVASRAYSVGELVYVNGNLYKVITAISGGATFTVGTNIQSTNVSGALNRVVVKSASFSGTTDPYGNVVISNTPINVFLATLDQGVINFPFIYLSSVTYLHIMIPDGTAVPNTPVSGTYYYIEE